MLSTLYCKITLLVASKILFTLHNIVYSNFLVHLLIAVAGMYKQILQKSRMIILKTPNIDHNQTVPKLAKLKNLVTSQLIYNYSTYLSCNKLEIKTILICFCIINCYTIIFDL